MAPCKLVRLSAYNGLQPLRLSLSRAFILHPEPLGAPGVDLDDGTVLAHGRRRRSSRARLGRERLARAWLGRPRPAQRLCGVVAGIVVVVVLGFRVWRSSFGGRGSGFRVQGLEMRDDSLSGCKKWLLVSWFRSLVKGLRIRVRSSGFRVQGVPSIQDVCLRETTTHPDKLNRAKRQTTRLFLSHSARPPSVSSAGLEQLCST